MMKKTVVIVSLVILLVSFVFFAFKATAKETGIDRSSILQKLNEVLENQQDILSRLDDMKKELYIIKIRASSR